MSLTGIIVSGLIAGFAMNVLGGIANGWLLHDAWAEVVESGKIVPPEGWRSLVSLLPDFAFGVALAWLYSFLSRGSRKGIFIALTAALFLWIVSVLIPHISMANVEVLPAHLLIASSVVALISFLVAGPIVHFIYGMVAET